MLDSLIAQMVRQEGITEQLKAERPMVWVGRMNNIHSRAEEIVVEEVINQSAERVIRHGDEWEQQTAAHIRQQTQEQQNKEQKKKQEKGGR